MLTLIRVIYAKFLFLRRVVNTNTYVVIEIYTLFQIGRHFIVLFFTCKLALFASFLNSKEYFPLNEATGANLQVNKRILKWRPFWNKVYNFTWFFIFRGRGLDLVCTLFRCSNFEVFVDIYNLALLHLFFYFFSYFCFLFIILATCLDLEF